MLEYDNVQDPKADIPSSSCSAAYLMWQIQNSIALDSSCKMPMPLIAPLVHNVWEIRYYAWDVGTLALLYRELGKASRAEARQIDGCLRVVFHEIKKSCQN